MYKKIAPLLPAIDLKETNLFYQNKLKFQTFYYGNYLVVQKEHIEIHFVELKDKLHFIASSCVIFDTNVTDLYAKFCSMDMITPAGNLKDNAFGKKEFFIIDNNGNYLRFCGY